MDARLPVPSELMATWLRLVRAMDRETLDAFARRAWPMFDPVSRQPLELALLARRRELAGAPAD